MKATVRFIRHGGIYRSDVSSHLADKGRSAAFRTGPAPAKRTRRKFPRPTHRRDEFRPAIPQRGARQHCPSPLHRHAHPNSVPGSGTMNLQRTVNSVLTVCLSLGDNLILFCGSSVCCPGREWQLRSEIPDVWAEHPSLRWHAKASASSGLPLRLFKQP